MLLVLGLIILIGAGVVGAVAVLDNRGASHQLSGGFHAFGHVFHGSSGQLFFWGGVVGAAAMLGLFLLLGGIRRDLQLRAQARRDGVRSVRRTRPVRDAEDRSVVAEDVRDPERDEVLPSTAETTATTRDRESELVRSESEERVDHEGNVKA